MHTSEARCNTTVTLTRADQLRLGDKVVMPGTLMVTDVVLVTVRTMALEGNDDVVLTFFGSLVGEVTTSVGNTFHVVDSKLPEHIEF